MAREKLIAALRAGALRSGFTPYYGPAYRINSQIDMLPAAWIEPLKLLSKSGRRECRATYRVTIKMMAAEGMGGFGSAERAGGAEFSSGVGREKQWAELEEAFLKIAAGVAAEDFVASVGALKSACAELSLTSKGEISLEGQMDITVLYVDPAGAGRVGPGELENQ